MTRFAPPEPVNRSSLQRCALTGQPRFIASTSRLVGIITGEYKGLSRTREPSRRASRIGLDAWSAIAKLHELVSAWLPEPKVPMLNSR